MKQTSEQTYKEIVDEDEELRLRQLPPKPAKGYWIANSQTLKDLAEEMEKVNPYLRGGSRGLFSDDILHKELNND